jgi:Signal transduction histidine kinase
MPLTIVIAIGCILLGTIVFALVNYRAVKKKNRKLEKALSSYSEKAEGSLADKIKLSKTQLETAFDAITDYICAIDREYKIVRVNKSYAGFVKFPIREILGRQCYEVFWKLSSPCDRCPAGRTFLQGTPETNQRFSQRDLMNVRYFDVGTYPVAGADGATENVIEYIRDVTEEKNIMEQLIRSEKLATIGTMTAGIAHEMINPLSGISGTVTNMLKAPDKYGLNPKGVQRVSTLRDAAGRATMIMKDLLHLSRKEEGTSVLTDINTIVRKAVNAVQLKGMSSIEYKLLLEKTMPMVLCDPVKIEQVVINITTNAVQSIVEKRERLALAGKEHNGMIIISTQPVDGMAHIDIIDNGMGISDDVKGKIFDPFFTTRAPGEGTGLGLSVCHRIVEEHNGRIVVESNNGLTTFSIILPVHKREEERSCIRS